MRPLLKLIYLLLLVTVATAARPAWAFVNYQLDTSRAKPGETLYVKGVATNETKAPITWTPQKTLPIQWQDAAGQVMTVTATLVESPTPVTLAPGQFAAQRWALTVPKDIQGLQTLAVDNSPTLMALQADNPNLPVPAHHADAAGLPPAPEALPVSSSPFETFRRAISPYEPIYFDVGGRDGTNARFQVSFKYRLFSPENPVRPAWYDHFYLGYTQTSLWDLEGSSKPFIDSTYNPGIFWHNPALVGTSDQQWIGGLAMGVEHRSNGKSGIDSRSINDAYIQPELNYRFDGGSILSFMSRAKAYFSKNENPDFADYAGYVDWKLRWAQPNGLILTGLYRQGKSGRTATQLEAAWPLQRTFLNMNGFLHVQYFRGWGETLLGYNQKSDGQVRIGIALVP